MTTIELTESLDDERLAPILPLIAEAWRDGEPSDLEVAAICLEVLMSRRGVGCKEALSRWLDRSQPPSTTDLANLRARVSGSPQASGTAPGRMERA